MNTPRDVTHSHAKSVSGRSARPALFVSDTAARRLNSSVPTGTSTDTVQVLLVRLTLATAVFPVT